MWIPCFPFMEIYRGQMPLIRFSHQIKCVQACACVPVHANVCARAHVRMSMRVY
jgi:hypothetical protein